MTTGLRGLTEGSKVLLSEQTRSRDLELPLPSVLWSWAIIVSAQNLPLIPHGRGLGFQ